MSKILRFVCSALFGAAFLSSSLGLMASRADLVLLVLFGWGTVVLYLRDAVVKKIDRTNGNEIGIISALFYGIWTMIFSVSASLATLLGVDAVLAASIAAALIVVVAARTARMHA